MEFLSEEWLEAARAELGGAVEAARASVPDLTVQYVVSGTPSGKVAVVARIADGALVELGTGKAPDADVTVSLSAPLALAILAGDLAPEVGFMRGDIKVEGRHRLWLLDLRDCRRSPTVREALARLAAATDPLA
ncbi:MAG: hypothetical protein D6683_17265 [Actinomyces sp.]|nr:MAG: hypothetical protein D6683_17265 [Actinomyces sp.]